MRQIRAISLIALLTVPAVTCFCYLKWQKAHVRHEIKEKLVEGMDRSELTAITVPLANLNTSLTWEHEREFELKGEMYDVVEQQIHGDSITLLCWHDKEETELNDLLTLLTSRNLSSDPDNQSAKDRVLNYFRTLFTTDLQDQATIGIVEYHVLNNQQLMLLSCSRIPPPTPPPVV
jgi:hypothetical protein